ncbi:MAG TPA: FAD-dependent oxidoreductase [Streptosporangiaceae bacterium]|nr:FAD-dependent oxidoreductase [Streptosporangiaceae bacterium]
MFGTQFVYGNPATRLAREQDRLVVGLQDGSEAQARAVLIATGVSYRRLEVPELEALVGAGVFYGAGTIEAQAVAGRPVFVVGGGNSAGQAALHLSKYAAHVTILIRSGPTGTDLQCVADQAEPPRESSQRQRGEGGQVRPRRRRDAQWCNRHRAGQYVCGSRDGDGDARDCDGAIGGRVQEGKSEDEVSDVDVMNLVQDAEPRGVGPQQDRLPLGHRMNCDQATQRNARACCERHRPAGNVHARSPQRRVQGRREQERSACADDIEDSALTSRIRQNTPA